MPSNFEDDDAMLHEVEAHFADQAKAEDAEALREHIESHSQKEPEGGAGWRSSAGIHFANDDVSDWGGDISDAENHSARLEMPPVIDQGGLYGHQRSGEAILSKFHSTEIPRLLKKFKVFSVGTATYNQIKSMMMDLGYVHIAGDD